MNKISLITLMFLTIFIISNVTSQNLYTFEQNPKAIIHNLPVDLSGAQEMESYGERRCYFDRSNQILIEITIAYYPEYESCNIQNHKLILAIKNYRDLYVKKGYVWISTKSFDLDGVRGNTDFYKAINKDYMAMQKVTIFKNENNYKLVTVEITKKTNNPKDFIRKFDKIYVENR